ncbi:EscU/YscU/HrcU family type III secretion system export apparatus switch protein [Tepidibacillus fermentans]|uniref:Flagellar biosynthesis protein n=1 Tax=Tepidibacillus fermentans TaxID=1281767 RepID=A0A4R3K8I6_9BACI|nr:EscU/YscU/HrcU family type III secretion system export apparatus switch protein [Tepidibacillus fermentans]TCS79205.1 flagellar biosynthesis protein [Tepidibacillus fermentans]
MNFSQKKKAVALKYIPNQDQAPHLIGKGEGYLAEKIIEEAKNHQVLIHEDDALVQILYQLELNSEIPSELYSVIAEIFALVYQAEKMAKRG